ncbi:MAG TPA: S9 family peptidase [Kofleriaceae bacterium]|nr:S9 family peptidase [Kofleriaceae bacterium]
MTKHLLVALALVSACKTVPNPPMPQPQPPAVAQPQPPPVEPPAPPPKTAVAGHPKQDLIARSVLFGNPERVNPELSPDGKYVSWLAPKDGVLNVYVAPVGKLDQAKPVTAETTRPVRMYFWTFDNKHLVYLQDVGGDENFHLWRTSVDGGDVVDLTPYKGARAIMIGVSEKKPKTLLVGLNDRDPKNHDVYSIDIATGKRTLVFENKDGYLGFDADPQLQLRLATKNDPSGTVTIFTRKGTGWAEWMKIPYEDSDTTQTLWIDNTGKTLYAMDSRDRDTAALFSIDLATKKKQLIAEDPRVDLGETIVHPTTRKAQAAAFTYDKTRWQVIDKAIQADVDGITKLAAGAEWTIASRSLDDKQWLVAMTSDVTPGSYYLWDHAKRAGTFLFAAQPKLVADQLAHTQPVVIKSRDNLDLQSYLTLPREADPDGDGKVNAPVPMMLWVHGGPWGRDRFRFNPFAQLFANRGYAVLQVNFRGSTGFGKKFVNIADLQWSKAMHDDLLDAVDWAVKNGIAPKQKICIGGGSYGGYATLVGLAMTPDVFACGVDLVGPSNLNTLVATIPPYWTPMISRFKKRIGDWDTPEGKQLMAAASPLTNAAKIKRPLLIGQGANDPRVKQAESEQIVAAMKQANLPVTYVVFPDEGHGFARPENNIAFFGVAEAFLSAHLGGFYQPITKDELDASSMQVKEGKDGIPGLP